MFNIKNKQSSRDLSNSANNLEDLKDAIRNYNGCITLRKGSANMVFARSLKTSCDNDFKSVMLIGEAPGKLEDKFGIPFCGRSGKLLDEMLLKANVNKEYIYITNSVFWRPKDNRRPTIDEISECKPFVEKHISLVNPKCIILLGKTAAESVLDIDRKISITKIKSKVYRYTNVYLKNKNNIKYIPLYVVFHPAYILRKLSKKDDMIQEFKNIFNLNDFNYN